MTPKKIIAIDRAISELTALKLPYKAARDVRRLSSAIESEIHIIAGQEEKWIIECGGKIKNGNAVFESEALGAEYGKWRDDMLNTELDITLPECDLSAYIEQIIISPSALAALDGIVRFEDGR